MLPLRFYLAVRKEASSQLVDGTGHRPHYSLRTLCRALKYAADNPCRIVQRSLYEVGGRPTRRPTLLGSKIQRPKPLLL